MLRDPRKTRKSLTILVVALIATSCTETTEPLFQAGRHQLGAEPTTAENQEPYPLAPNALSRWDAPWWEMSDFELAEHIANAGGRAIIGFKEPGARAGVDDYGRVLVSPSTVQNAKEEFALRGFRILYEYQIQ